MRASGEPTAADKTAPSCCRGASLVPDAQCRMPAPRHAQSLVCPPVCACTCMRAALPCAPPLSPLWVPPSVYLLLATCAPVLEWHGRHTAAQWHGRHSSVPNGETGCTACVLCCLCAVLPVCCPACYAWHGLLLGNECFASLLFLPECVVGFGHVMHSMHGRPCHAWHAGSAMSCIACMVGHVMHSMHGRPCHA